MEITSNVSSQALDVLQSDLRGLSKALHTLYDDMNADMSNVSEFWQDPKYQEFVNGYRPQINKCEEISQRYNQWCSTVLQEAKDKVVKIEMTDVGSSVGGGAAITSNGGLTTGVVETTGKSNNISGFYLGGDNTTKAVPISNGCGSDLSPLSQAGAKIGMRVDAMGESTREEQIASCDQHDKDYYNGIPKEKADNDFTERSPLMGRVVKSFDKKSQESYDVAQIDRLTSQQKQPTWESENQQCLNSEDYKVISNVI